MATELDKLDAIPESVTLRSGTVIMLEPLKARQFFKLLRIITHGALPGMQSSGLFDMDGLDSEEFIGRLLSVTLLSIPDAEDETILFLRSLCYPAGLIERKGLNKQDVEKNRALWESLDEELENPDLDDLVTIIEAVIKREASDIQALGKRLASMLKLAEKTGQLNTPSESPSPSESTPVSSAGSRGRSTSSRRSTAGKTKTSTTSPLDDYDSASQPSESDSTTSVGTASNG